MPLGTTLRALFLFMLLALPSTAFAEDKFSFWDLLGGSQSNSNSNQGQYGDEDGYYRQRDQVRESADLAYKRQQSVVNSQQVLKDLYQRKEEAQRNGSDTSGIDQEIQHVEQAVRDDRANFEAADRNFRNQRRQLRRAQEFSQNDGYNNGYRNNGYNSGYDNGYNRNFQRRRSRFSNFDEDEMQNSDRYDRWR
jgi:hypothetical protein